ncbi:MAG: putative portal protein [Prokaryotic dsDNA virus sp.]|nr:MAG: putative portal protein [Prokaryotic dsDNA virus sp.]|tara:strand:+ start:12697 stop:14901 length:2205 start_codon:yes stop_codon:yes gene_type:complete
MKDNIISINLGTETAPIVQEVRGKDYIEYGTDNWKNLYPQFLIDLYYNSSTNAAIINATADLISAEDIVIDNEDDRNLDALVKLKQFMASANSNESLHEVIKKCAFDFKLQGGFALNIIWSRDRTQIAEIYHIPMEKIRVEKPDAMGKVNGYYVSADWSNTRQNKPYRVPAFNVNDRTSPNQILYTGLYSPNMNAYFTPDYLAGNNWSLIDQKVAEFHLNNINSGFSGSYAFNFANGVPTQEERLEIERRLSAKFQGSENAGKVIVTFSDDNTRTPQITPIQTSDLDKQFLTLQELLVSNILTAHRVTSPLLMGIRDSGGGLGSNVDEINSAANYFLNTVCKPYQSHIIKVLRKLFRVNNMDMPISFVQLKPITLEFTSEDLKAVMEQDEIREELGLPPLNENVEVRQDFAKVGSMVTEGKDGEIDLPLYDSIEEAEAEAEKLGCKGHHVHTLDGKEVYMPCEDHEQIKQITNLKDCNCKEEFITPNPCQPGYEAIGTKIKDGREVPNCVPVNAKKELSELTELDKFIKEYGEEIPEEWEMIDEEIVDGEHQDFDFEKTMNDHVNEKIELASTGTARPNARSEQDGVNKSFNDYYKVRYVYTEDEFLVNKTGQQRNFCRKMVAANKIYRKEDIMRMGKMTVNDYYYSERQGKNIGWGPRGALQYSIWLYKGGGNCQHFWLRRIYKTSLRNAKNKISDSQIIGYTKARSEGFTAEKNDNLVARPPKRMANNGFLN